MSHFVSIRNGMGNADEKDLANSDIAFLVSGGGVVGTNDYLIQAQGSPNNTVQVGTGRAYVPTSDGTMVYSTLLDASQNVTIAANATGSTQIDSIVLYIDLSASPDSNASNVAKFADVRGTGGVAPTNSAILTAIGASNPYIILANISVLNGFTSINSGNITDKRAFATPSTSYFKSGSNTVSIAAAGTPSTGQVLVATSSSTATWQNPSGKTVQTSTGLIAGSTQTQATSGATWYDVTNAWKTFTPTVASYGLFTFNSSVGNNSAGGRVDVQVLLDGTTVGYQVVLPGVTTDASTPVSISGIITLTAAVHTLKVQFSDQSAGGHTISIDANSHMQLSSIYFPQ